MSKTNENEIDKELKEIIDFILKNVCYDSKVMELEPKELVLDIMVRIAGFNDLDYYKMPNDVYVLKVFLGDREDIFIIKDNIIKGYSCEIER